MTPEPEGVAQTVVGRLTRERLEPFKKKTIAHPILKQVDSDLWHAIREPGGTFLVNVVGPTGVGKTTLRRKIEHRVTEEALPELQNNPGRLPVVAVEAVAPESGNFNWKDFYFRALMEMAEPLIDRKIDYGAQGTRPASIDRAVMGSTPAAPTLRRALEQCLRHRRPQAFLIDESQHLMKMASGRRLLDQMDVIKSLASMTGIVFVLFGTYDLLKFMDLSAQLNRRTMYIHFPRYRPDNPEDVTAFKRVLYSFQRSLPLEEESDLLEHWEFCYERSVGCIGVLKDWLTRALAAVLEAGRPRLTRADLEKWAAPAGKLVQLAHEISEGEEQWAGLSGASPELDRLLGMSREGSPIGGTREPSGVPAQQVAPAPRQPRRRAGQRKPTRDPVGEAAHGG